MIKVFRHTLILALSFLTMDASAASYYIVKSGQTLSQIAREQFEGHLYGKNGAVEKLLALNPKIKNPNLIYTDQKIKLVEIRETKRSLSSEEETIVTAELEKNISEVKPVSAETKLECTSPTRSGVGIRIGAMYFRINSSDPATSASSTLLSEMSPTVDLYWKLDLNDSWTTRFGYSSASFNVLQTDATASKTLSNNSGSLNAMDFGVTYKWTPASRTELFLGTKEKLFQRATTATTISIEKVITPIFGLDHSFDLYKISSIILGSHLQVSSEQPGEGIGYKTKSGTSGLLGFSLSHQTKSLNIQGEVYYNFSQQNSDIVEQKSSTAGTKVGIEWRF